MQRMNNQTIAEAERNNDSSSGKLHYAWIVAFAGLLITGAGIGIFTGCLGVFIKPVCESLRFSRGEFSMYSAISTLVCVVLMPFFGTLFKRFGFRRIAIISAVLCGLTLFGYSISNELWQFYALASLSGLFINGIGVMSVGILVNKWFINARGLATGIAYSGSGLLAAILIPMANKFIELNGWRWTYRFLGFVSLLVLIPVILLIVKDKPEDIGLEPYKNKLGSAKDEHPVNRMDTGITREEAFHTHSFWLLAMAVMGITLCQAGPHVHTVSFLNDIGYSTAFAASVASTYMILLTGCKVVMGFVFDRLGSLKGSMLIGGCCVLFPIAALLASFPAAPWIYALLLAMASSGSTILGTILTTNYFGSKDFPGVYSIISMFSYIGVAISSPFLGAIYDANGSYSLAWVLITGMGMVVCACLFYANRTSKKIAFSMHHDSAAKVTVN